MQIGNLNSKIYKGFGKRLEFAIEYLRSHDCSKYQPGKYEVNDYLFILIQNYEAKDKKDVRFEAHDRYADVQYILKGREAIGYADRKALSPIAPFDESADIGFYADPEEYNTAVLSAGQYGIFMPDDAHKPSYCPEGERPAKVLKAVLKIRID